MSVVTLHPLRPDDWPELLGLVATVVAATYGDASPALRNRLADNRAEVMGG